MPGVPVYRCTGVPVSGIAIELVTACPNRPGKVRLTLPKGLGPLLKEVISDRFRVRVGLHHGLRTPEGETGLDWAQAAEDGSKRAQNGPDRSVRPSPRVGDRPANSAYPPGLRYGARDRLGARGRARGNATRARDRVRVAPETRPYGNPSPSPTPTTTPSPLWIHTKGRSATHP